MAACRSRSAGGGGRRADAFCPFCRRRQRDKKDRRRRGYALPACPMFFKIKGGGYVVAYRNSICEQISCKLQLGYLLITGEKCTSILVLGRLNQAVNKLL